MKKTKRKPGTSTKKVMDSIVDLSFQAQLQKLRCVSDALLAFEQMARSAGSMANDMYEHGDERSCDSIRSTLNQCISTMRETIAMASVLPAEPVATWESA